MKERLVAALDARLDRPIATARVRLLIRSILGLLGFDCVVDLAAHGGRYGVGGFNVAHFGFLDPLVAGITPAVYLALLFVSAGLALTLAFGRLRRASMIALTVTYTLSWSVSLLDAYQHHYLLSLLLVGLTAATCDEERPLAPNAGYVSATTTAAIVYAFTALTKLEPDWRSGDALTRLLTAGQVDAVAILGQRLGLAPGESMRALALSAIAVQLLSFAAYALAPRVEEGSLRGRVGFACAMLPPLVFHAGVLEMPLDVGWFTRYMIALALLAFTPREVLVPVDRLVESTLARLRFASEPFTLRVFTVLAAGALAIAWFALDLPGVATAAVVVVALVGVTAAWAVAKGRAIDDLPAALLLVAASTSFAVTHGAVGPLEASEVRYDYYRFVGGDHRRRGERAAAMAAYRKALRYAPDEARQDRVRNILARLRDHS